jgi:hypothetical protein
MSRVHTVWVVLNRPRRRGTLWIEMSVYVALVATWLIVTIGASLSNSPFWIAVPIGAWTVWVTWFRNHRPDEPLAVPQWDLSQTAGPLPPGMVYPSEWQATWLREQQERRRSPRYSTVTRAAWIVAVAVVVVGIAVGYWQIVAAGFFIGAVATLDRRRYAPRDHDVR